jgi:hypothetical protein
MGLPLPPCLLSSLPLDERHEGLPVPVEVDAAELEVRLGPLTDPPHSSAIKPLRDHMIHRPLHAPRSKLQVLSAKPGVVHLVDAVEEVVPVRLQAFPLALVPRSCLRDASQGLGEQADHLQRLAPVDQVLHLLHPSGQFLAPLLVEAAPGLPEVFHHMHDVEGVDDPGEEFPGVPRQVLIAIGDDLDAPAGAKVKAPLVRLSPGDGEGVALGGVRAVESPVDRAFQDPPAFFVGGLLEGVHDHQGDGPAVLGLAPLCRNFKIMNGFIQIALSFLQSPALCSSH